ncbi:60S ribosomal protein L5 [Entamoeba marina]
MGYLKVVKNRAYFKKYQTQFRRRREGKTDYYARKKDDLPKTKINSKPQNTDWFEIIGDKVLCSAYSFELPKYGVTLGLTNYAAAYCTGLLLARRLLNKLGMDKQFVGVDDGSKIGADYTPEEVEERRPFKCILDVGLARTTTGSKVFAVMKGMCDGGVYVPHSASRFVGAGEDEDVLRERILGGHVASYMKYLSNEDGDLYKRQFGRFINKGIKPEDLEQIYLDAHKKIRENPAKEQKEKKEYKIHPKQKKLTLEERKNAINAKLAKLAEQQ